MSLDDYSDGVAAARQHFEEGLIRAGFVERSEAWVGSVNHSAIATEVSIVLPSRFPFRPARVSPTNPDSVPWSWHRERDGSLCLVADDDHDNLWWVDADLFLSHAKDWLESSSAGWTDDRPDLDLDRYFEPSPTDTRLYLFSDLSQVTDRFVRFETISNNVMQLAGQGSKPRKSVPSPKRVYGFVVDLGAVAAPPRDWSDLSALIEPSHRIDARIRDRSVGVIVVRYQRDTQEGVVILEVWPNQAGGITAYRLLAASDTDGARAARSGPNAPNVKGKTVAVVGAGALGSFIADGLVRGGVDALTLIDGDRLTPGNLVRHLVGIEGVGLFKATAVVENLERRFPGLVIVQAVERNLMTADEAAELLQDFDLVINATADFSVTALLNAVAKSFEQHFLSVAIQNQGETFRIDIVPPLYLDRALPSSARVRTGPVLPLHFDSGCGSPISPTPPSAVIEAANAAVRHAFGLLLSDPISRVGEVRDLDLGHHTTSVAD